MVATHPRLWAVAVEGVEMKTERRIPSRRTTRLWLGIALVGWGCTASSTGYPLCPAIDGYFAVKVVTVDALTGNVLTGLPPGAVTDGEYGDSLHVTAFSAESGPELVPIAFGAAWNRPGTYTLTVEREGYQPFSVSGLVARTGTCWILQVSLTARLVPE